MRHPSLLSKLVVVLAMVSGCKSRPASELQSVSEPESALGDPQKGYYHMVNSNYIGCGIPLSLVRDAGFFTGILPKPIREYYFSMFDTKVDVDNPELGGREGENAKMPYFFNAFEGRHGTTVANFNCLACHGEKVDNNVIIGLGNATRDFTINMETVTKGGALLAAIKDEKAKKEWQLWSRSVEAMAPYMRPRVIGANPAVNLTYAIMSHLNPKTLLWSEKPLLPSPDTFVPPVDVPPWWRLKHRKTVFYNAEFTGDHRRFMMLASTMCVEGVDEAKKIEEMFFHVDAFISQLEAPKYPYRIEQPLADKGREIFNAQCSSCHGTYTEKGVQYSENLIPVDVVKTDPELWKMQAQRTDPYAQWVNDSWYGELGVVKAGNGYVSPPLNGIWVTAPFFHNGSVPTLEGVLDSSKRPKYWERPKALKEFDEVAVGWKVRSLEKGTERLLVPKKYTYDTTQLGYSNAGHTYGDSLKADERQAVIEYLKTL